MAIQRVRSENSGSKKTGENPLCRVKGTRKGSQLCDKDPVVVLFRVF